MLSNRSTCPGNPKLTETVLFTLTFSLLLCPACSLAAGRLSKIQGRSRRYAPRFYKKVLHYFVKLINKVTTLLICLRLSTSASVVRGLLAERLWASGHFSGGLAGVAGGDAPSLCPILCVIEAMWWLLCRRSPGVCSLAHTHTHHGGICSDTHYLLQFRTVDDF